MQESLTIVPTEGELRLDSRLLAKQLGYEYKVILQAIRRHKARLEAKSSLLQIEAVKPRETRGATREVYYMLNERQCLILTGSLKKGIEAEEWHDRLVDEFLQARAHTGT
jgi:phage regulator Rha-like protein